MSYLRSPINTTISVYGCSRSSDEMGTFSVIFDLSFGKLYLQFLIMLVIIEKDIKKLKCLQL